jgi:F0F1-type ATP synthase membrane subunit c/vacuolar-type H+-ATPase subunit K
MNKIIWIGASHHISLLFGSNETLVINYLRPRAAHPTIYTFLLGNKLDSLTLRNTADMAILVADTLATCAGAVGVGYADKNTIGATAKGCAVTSLGNIIGTMFGAVENKEVTIKVFEICKKW